MKRLFGATFAFVLLLPAASPLGQPLKLSSSIPIPELLVKPAPHIGKIVQVSGKVTEVCQMMGCWMHLVDTETGKGIRVKVNDGDIVFPKTAIGKIGKAEGKLVELKLTQEQAIARARHEAEEQGRKFNPATVKSGLTIYQIQATGAVILE